MPSTNQLYQSALTGAGQQADTFDANAAAAQNRYVQFLANGQQSLNTYAQGAMSAAMPQLNASLDAARANAARRGVANGALGTSYEGDVYSAFQRNLANALAGQSMNLYGEQASGYGNLYNTQVQQADTARNRFLDVLTGQRDYETAQANARRQNKRNVWGAIGAVGGGIIGGLAGGPAGAAAGASVGRSLGGF